MWSAPDMGWPELYERAGRRHNVVVRQDAVETDVGIKVYETRILEERWDGLYLGTRLIPGTRRTPIVRLASAWASLRPPAVVDLWSAAFVYGLRRPPTVPMLAVPANRRPRRRDLAVRRCANWNTDHQMWVNDLLVPRPARLLTDLANRGIDRDTLLDLGFRLRMQHPCTGEEIRSMTDTFGRLVGRGMLLEIATLLDTEGSDSGLEHRVRRLLSEAGFRPDAFQVTISTLVGKRRVDIAFSAQRVAIEVNSHHYHGGDEVMTRDAIKMNALEHDGEWRVFVVTPLMTIGSTWQEFCAMLAATLRTRGAREQELPQQP